MDDLMSAISLNERAVVIAPEGDPVRALLLNDLAIHLERRFQRTASVDDYRKAIKANEDAVAESTSTPSIRIKAAVMASNLLLRDSSISNESVIRARYVLLAAVDLLRRVSPRTLKQADQQYNISRFAEITSQAVSVCLECQDDVKDVLQVLERGRGILANLRLEVRSDVSILQASHPHLASQFENLRDQLDCPLGERGETPQYDYLTIVDQRRTLSEQFDTLLEFIRQLDGFESFLLDPSASELMALADLGPIVILNVSDFRSDALLVGVRNVRCLRLPALKRGQLEDQAARFLAPSMPHVTRTNRQRQNVS